MTDLSSDRFYDAVAPSYDELLDTDATNGVNRQEVAIAVRDALDPGSRILDFGAGTGSDWDWLLAAGYEVVSYEPSAGMRAVAAQRPVAHQVTLIDDLSSWLSDPFKARFDGILANFAVMNHVRDLQRVFATFDAILRPGGQLFLVVLDPSQGSAPRSVEYDGLKTPVYVHRVMDISAASQQYDLAVERTLTGNRFRLLQYSKPFE